MPLPVFLTGVKILLPLLAFREKKHYNSNTMDELKVLLQENLNIEFCQAVLSNPRKKETAEKVKVRPLLKRDRLVFQIETFRNHQAFHRNAEPSEACALIMEAMENMRQMQMETVKYLYTVLVSKKG